MYFNAQREAVVLSRSESANPATALRPQVTPVAVTGSRRWATENGHGVEFNANGSLEDVRFFAKGVLQAEAEALAAAVAPEPARIAATGGMGEAAAQPIAPRKRRTAKKGAAEQPALIAA